MKTQKHSINTETIRYANRIVRYSRYLLLDNIPEILIEKELELLSISETYTHDYQELVNCIENSIVKNIESNFKQIECLNCKYVNDFFINTKCPYQQKILDIEAKYGFSFTEVSKKNDSDIIDENSNISKQEREMYNIIINIFNCWSKDSNNIAQKCSFYELNVLTFNSITEKLSSLITLIKEKYPINEISIISRANNVTDNFLNDLTKKEFGESAHIACC